MSSAGFNANAPGHHASIQASITPDTTTSRLPTRAAGTMRESYASEEEPYRNLRGTRGLSLAPLAIERAERLVGSELEQVKRRVVREVEVIHCCFETADAQS